MSRRRVAVLGAGIMGSSLAINLARRGLDVVLVDRASEPMSASSRWNEGKIHLGYLYGADPSLATARHILPGGLRFGRLVTDLIGSDLASHTTTTDDTYLVHRDSVVDAAALHAHFEAVSDLVRTHPDAGSYLVDASRARVEQVPAHAVRDLAGDVIEAGFRVPERSVDTRWVADRLAAAVAAEPRVHLRLGTTVHRVGPVDSMHGPWRVQGEPDLDEHFDLVLNALWEGRLAVDATAGIDPGSGWSHRYRLSAFVRTRRPVELPSAIAAVGAFGDVKNFGDRDFYLSWYPVGLRYQSEDLVPPEAPRLDAAEEQAFLRDVRRGLETVLPTVGTVFAEAEEALVRGGQVFARGTGSIGERGSSLHRRDRFGVERHGAYLSIDTGKYSTAPWLADRLAREITGS